MFADVRVEKKHLFFSFPNLEQQGTENFLNFFKINVCLSFKRSPLSWSQPTHTEPSSCSHQSAYWPRDCSTQLPSHLALSSHMCLAPHIYNHCIDVLKFSQAVCNLICQYDVKCNCLSSFFISVFAKIHWYSQ